MDRPHGLTDAQVARMLGIFSSLRVKGDQAGRELQEKLAGGWIARYKPRPTALKRQGDVYVVRDGEPKLRSKLDVQRRLGLIAPLPLPLGADSIVYIGPDERCYRSRERAEAAARKAREQQAARDARVETEAAQARARAEEEPVRTWWWTPPQQAS